MRAGSAGQRLRIDPAARAIRNWEGMTISPTTPRRLNKGSWNRRPKSGYQVVFVPFADGKPKGKPVPVLTGFLDAKERARGRPVDVALDRTGALLVADDAGGRVWRVSAK